MNAPDRQTPHDPDDWFDEPDPTPPRRAGHAPAQVDPDAQTRERTSAPIDDWLAPAPPTHKQRSPRATTIAKRRTLGALAIALALVLVGLALGGVFSGSGKRMATPPPERHTTSTTTQTAAPLPALPASTVKPGDRGTPVKELQQALKSLGITVGTIDGIFGPATEHALTAFQSAHQLSPDGVLGPATRAALLNALRSG